MGLINNTPPSLSALGTFGAGSDGDVVLTSNLNLNRDMYYNNLTINSGVTLCCESFRIFVRDTFLNYGILGTAPSHGHVGQDDSGGYGGGGSDQHVLPVGQSGGDGGAPGAVSPNMPVIYNCLGGGGGKGGHINYQSGSVQALSDYNSMYSRPLDIVTAGLTGYYWEGVFVMYNVGRGGSGGGGGYGTGGGGGGGAGGDLLFLSARSIRNYGTIHAKGGNGGNGYNSPGSETCGGGGGGGGCILLLYNNLVDGTLDVSGGIGGTGSEGPGDGTGLNGEIGHIIKIDNYL